MYTLVTKSLTMTSATALEVLIPQGSKGHLFRVEAADGTEWRVSSSEAAASTGFPLEAPEAFEVADPNTKQSVFFYQASGGDLTLHWSYQQPVLR